MSEDEPNGVFIGDAYCFVRLRRIAERRPEDGMTSVEIDVKGGPFAGLVRDDSLIGIGKFGADLRELHRTLNGSATLTSYDHFRLTVQADSLGGVHGEVEVYGNDPPSSKLTFDISLDQSFLPHIVRALKREFPQA